MPLPNFNIIGAMKAGTTSLASYLASHPEVFMSTPKEPGFFNQPDPSTGVRAAYERLFEGGEDAKAIGVDTDQVLQRFLTQRPTRFSTAEGDVRLNGVLIDVSSQDGRASSIERIEHTADPREEGR